MCQFMQIILPTLDSYLDSQEDSFLKDSVESVDGFYKIYIDMDKPKT